MLEIYVDRISDKPIPIKSRKHTSVIFVRKQYSFCLTYEKSLLLHRAF